MKIFNKDKRTVIVEEKQDIEEKKTEVKLSESQLKHLKRMEEAEK